MTSTINTLTELQVSQLRADLIAAVRDSFTPGDVNLILNRALPKPHTVPLTEAQRIAVRNRIAEEVDASLATSEDRRVARLILDRVLPVSMPAPANVPSIDLSEAAEAYIVDAEDAADKGFSDKKRAALRAAFLAGASHAKA